MKKIKIIGAIVVVCVIILALISQYINTQNKLNLEYTKKVNQQKAFVHQISKDVLYMYKNNNTNITQLEQTAKKFTKNIHQIFDTPPSLYLLKSVKMIRRKTTILNLWDQFYLQIKKFKKLNHNPSIYSNLLLEKTVNNIYKINLDIIKEFDQLLNTHQQYTQDKLYLYKLFQYVIFFLLFILLIYLLTQVKHIITFVQNFKKTTEDIIKTSSVSQIKPLKNDNTNPEIKDATNNFNTLLDNINNSINYSHKSIEHTTKSLDKVAKDIEIFLTVLSELDESHTIDIHMAKKEDIAIQSLEELTNLTEALKNLQYDLNQLVKHKN